MSKTNYLLRYVKFAPLQIALIRAEEAFFMAKIKYAKPILDIGASDGIFGEILFNNKKGSIKAGIDIDEIALTSSKKRKVYAKTFKVDARQLPFKSDSFSTVISNQSLEHIENVEKVVKEVSRVLKKDGKFVFLVPTVYLDDYWLTSAFFKTLKMYEVAKYMHDVRNKIFGHYNLWPVGKWKNLLEINNFKLQSYQYIGSRKNYFVSELFWPMRIPFFIASRIFKREILPPRTLSLILAKILSKLLNYDKVIKTDNGPTMIVIAQKR